MSQHHRLYCTAAWRRLRVAQLTEHPLCRMCEALGQLVIATVCDHVVPHRGDLALFYAETNLQSLCKPCHDSHKQAQEHNADGILRGAGQDGQPLDLSHPFYRPARPEIARSWALGVQTSAPLAGPAVASPRACAASPAAIAGTAQTPGGGKSCRPRPSHTAYVPSFATCHNSEGGV